MTNDMTQSNAAFGIQVLSLAALVGASILSLVTQGPAEAGVLGVRFGAAVFAVHGVMLIGGIVGIATGARWTVPVVVTAAAAGITTAKVPDVEPAAVAVWVAYGALVMAHVELREGAARIRAWSGRLEAAAVDEARLAHDYLRRAALALAATAALAWGAATAPVWGGAALPANVRHSLEVGTTYGVLLGVVGVLGILLLAAVAIRVSRQDGEATA